MVVLDVVGALIEAGDKFLVAQRNPDDRFASLWEFPGGKVEEKENKKEALKREITEELGIQIEVDELIYNFEDEIRFNMLDLCVFYVLQELKFLQKKADKYFKDE